VVVVCVSDVYFLLIAVSLVVTISYVSCT